MATKVVTLKLNKEFKRAYYQGKFKTSNMLVTYLVKHNYSKPWVGITASKKIGNAVYRNRCRRIIKQAYREILNEKEFNLKKFDIVFVARADTGKYKTQDIKKVMKKHINTLISIHDNKNVKGTPKKVKNGK